MSRAYMQTGIAELERLFETSREDRRLLGALRDELVKRSTERAGRLRRKVEAELAREVDAAPVRAAPASGPVDRTVAVEPSPAQPSLATSPGKPERKQPRPHPPVRDQAEDVLSAWTALEVLSPATYRKPEDLAQGDRWLIAKLGAGRPLPWMGEGEKSRPKKRLFYHVVLGGIRMPEATTDLLSVFVDKNQDRRPTRGFAAIGTVTVDKTGCPVAEDACTLSSFAWGLPLALGQDLVALGRWPEAEPKLLERLDAKLRRKDREGKPVPLDWTTITVACDWLVGELGLARSLVEPPSFAIRAYHYMFAQEPPESPLLGSFFLKDLASAAGLVRAGKAPANLQRYLGITAPAQRHDVLRDVRHVQDAVAPSRMPPGRWPSKGRHPLVTLQQMAVNVAAGATEGAALVPVNGPPGTGKTTLLRDLVADLVMKRAKAMCGFDDPERAFAPAAEITLSNAKVRLSRIDPKLRGFEMIVASSNNAAVENVSKALPMLDAVAADATGLRYFKTVSDFVGGTDATWGLVAAVLGNSKNRYDFGERAWRDKDHGLQTYLAEAAGVPQWIEGTPENPEPRRKPRVIERERPPSDRTEALRRWREARQEFAAALSDVEARLASLERAGADLARVDGLVAAARSAASAAVQAEAAAGRSRSKHVEADAAAGHAKAREREAADAVSRVEATRPGLPARLFRTASARDWRINLAAVKDRHGQAVAASGQAAALRAAAERQSRDDAAAARSAAEAGTAAEAARDGALERVAALRRRSGPRLVDASYFEAGHQAWNQSSPWLSDEDHKARDRVFEAAMAVHRAFVDASAKHLRHNLEAIFRSFYSNLGASPRVKPLVPDLWTSLFLVVPVVSTTFASVEKMLSGLPPEGLGWLLVDEAGQAVPQAVVGAMTRTKRAIVVGDPLQVQPVTTLPTDLAEAICLQFGVDPQRWNAPEASVQTVADASSQLGAEFEQNVGSVRVGLPLLVHRRCMEPMFSISNKIAYSGQMVHATQGRPSAIRDAVGPSRWIDVPPAHTEDKWSEDEGNAVLALIGELAEAGVTELDLYVITPFRIVEQRLKERIRSSGLLSAWPLDPWKWTESRVGTVHKVQGREADSVIFVLGAPLPAQRGARIWAGAQPNILNVAVTRAQENLYVVGSRSAWADAGAFAHLATASSLPSRTRKTYWDGKEEGPDEREVARRLGELIAQEADDDWKRVARYLDSLALEKSVDVFSEYESLDNWCLDFVRCAKARRSGFDKPYLASRLSNYEVAEELFWDVMPA